MGILISKKAFSITKVFVVTTIIKTIIMTKADNNNNENNSNNNSNNDNNNNNNNNNNNICSPMTFPPMGNSDHVVVSVSVDFPQIHIVSSHSL